MSLTLPNLYHWSPKERRTAINRGGLKPSCPTADTRSNDAGPPVLMVCLGASPSQAWSLSGDVFGTEGEDWDLWQVAISDEDEVHPLPNWGYRLNEIRVANRIPKSRIWRVGTRTKRRSERTF